MHVLRSADEARVVWRKSSFSSPTGNCVEVANAGIDGMPDPVYLVRHSKEPHGPALVYTTPEWDAFVAGVKKGEFDPHDS